MFARLFAPLVAMWVKAYPGQLPAPASRSLQRRFPAAEHRWFPVPLPPLPAFEASGQFPSPLN